MHPSLSLLTASVKSSPAPNSLPPAMLAPPMPDTCSAAYQQVWTEKGVVYGGIPNGLVHGEASFVIPKPQSSLIIGPYQKGDDSKIFIYPIDTLLVRQHPCPCDAAGSTRSLPQL